MHDKGLLSANLCLVSYFIKLGTICSTFERVHLQVKMVNKTSSFKTKLIGSNAETSKVNCTTFRCLTFPCSRQQSSHYKQPMEKRRRNVNVLKSI